MNTYREALTQLTKGDMILIDGKPKHRDPLIHLLREARYPSTGKGSTERGGNRGVLNTAAIDLYEHIDSVARSTLNGWQLPYAGILETVLEQMFEAIQAETAVWMSEDEADRHYARFPEWVTKITDLLDPPHHIEIGGTCPHCNQTHHTDGDTVNLTLVAIARPGHAPLVECRSCQAVWVTRDDLLHLAEHVGATIDWETLKHAHNT